MNARTFSAMGLLGLLTATFASTAATALPYYAALPGGNDPTLESALVDRVLDAVNTDLFKVGGGGHCGGAIAVYCTVPHCTYWNEDRTVCERYVYNRCYLYSDYSPFNPPCLV